MLQSGYSRPNVHERHDDLDAVRPSPTNPGAGTQVASGIFLGIRAQERPDQETGINPWCRRQDSQTFGAGPGDSSTELLSSGWATFLRRSWCMISASVVLQSARSFGRPGDRRPARSMSKGDGVT